VSNEIRHTKQNRRESVRKARENTMINLSFNKPKSDIQFLKTKHNKKIFISLEDLKQITDLPKDNEQIRILTDKGFNIATALLLICEKEIILDAVFSVYRINPKAIEIITSLIQIGKIKNLHILLNHNIGKQKPELYAPLTALNKICIIEYNDTHMKIMTAKTEQNNYIFEGSGNLSNNSRFEQYIFENNAQVLEFYSNAIKNIKSTQYRYGL
jgi:hypothetical protein